MTAPPGPRVNPFPGLRPFREEEEYLFFGRERQVDAMLEKLAATRFLAVVGSSGSGCEVQRIAPSLRSAQSTSSPIATSVNVPANVRRVSVGRCGPHVVQHSSEPSA